MLCEVWNLLNNLKNVKNAHGGAILSVKLKASDCSFTKNNTLPWMFFYVF